MLAYYSALLFPFLLFLLSEIQYYHASLWSDSDFDVAWPQEEDLRSNLVSSQNYHVDPAMDVRCLCHVETKVVLECQRVGLLVLGHHPSVRNEIGCDSGYDCGLDYDSLLDEARLVRRVFVPSAFVHAGIASLLAVHRIETGDSPARDLE